MRTHYRVNEIFRSPQGEGFRQGDDSVFVRLTGCNLRCKIEPGHKSPGGFDCDTEFVSGVSMTAEKIVEEVCRIAAADRPGATSVCQWVVLTGGEPTLQADRALLDALHAAGKLIQMETNGTRAVPHGVDFITVSPKVAEHAIRQRTAHEVKYVRGAGQGIPRTVVKADHYYVSPAFIGEQLDDDAVQHCRELAAKNPPWKVSVQMHKLWRVR